MTEALLNSISFNLDRASEKLQILEEHSDTIEALIDAGEARRLDRVDAVRLRNVRWSSGRILGEANSKGSDNVYDVRITMSPRGHHCTCLDWQVRGKSVGPCKHVLALGYYWRSNRITPALEKMDTALKKAVSK